MSSSFISSRSLSAWIGLTACAATAALSVGCESALPPLRLDGVRPDHGYYNTETSLTITGRNFFPTVTIDAARNSEADFDAQFQVYLVGEAGEAVPLTGVDLMDYETLEADVPAGLAPGDYDLLVISPAGLEGTNSDVTYRATESRGEKLVFVGEEQNWLVETTATMDFQLVNNSGGPESENHLVVISMSHTTDDTADSDEGEITFVDSNLEDYELTGDGVVGLMKGGVGNLKVTSSDVGTINVTVNVLDPDSTIDGFAHAIPFVSSDLAVLEVLLPDDFSAIAGEGFEVTVQAVDKSGELMTEDVDVSLLSSCGGTAEIFTLRAGVGSTEVEVTQATEADEEHPCHETVLIASSGEITGSSKPFTVQAAALSSFEVLVYPGSAKVTEIVAGQPNIDAQLLPTDRYGNAVLDYDGVLVISDGIGGLDETVGLDEGVCARRDEGRIVCDVRFMVADEAVVVTVTDQETGASGQSVAFEVAPDEPVEVEVIPADTTPRADEPYTLDVTVYDQWGNEARVSLSDYKLVVADDVDETSCGAATELAPGVFELNCESIRAGARTLTATVTAVADAADVLIGEASLEVSNGALSRLALTLPGDPVIAGASFELAIDAFDKWDNPYIDQHTGAIIALADSSGTLTPTSVTLPTTATVTVRPTLTVSGSTTIDALQDGVTLGSVTLLVSPASLDHLTVALDSAWTWIETPLAANISARDRFENLIEDYTDEVAVTSAEGGFPERRVALQSGEGELLLSWDTAALQDVVTAASDDASGESESIDALDGDCDNGPSASLDLDGGDSAVTCFTDPEGTVDVVVDATAGDASISAVHLGVIGGEVDGAPARLSRVLLPATTELASPTTGVYTVEAVAVDQDACGQRVSGSWWVSEADDGPAGPVEIIVDTVSLVVGDPSSVATATVSARDCTGDPATAGSTLVVRSNLGDIEGASETGQGLSLVLEPFGVASFDFSAVDTRHGGPALIVVGRPDSSAYGEIAVELTGDNALPYVIDATPTGTVDGVIDTLSIVLSEPLNSLLTLTDGQEVSLEGPDGVVAIDALTHNGNVVTLEVEDLDASAGVYSLLLEGNTVGGSLLDRSGNRLDGRYQGAPSDYFVDFGATADAGLTVLDCEPSVDRFYPDGDDGSGEEADAVTFDVEASSRPTWWQLEVLDASGAVARFWRFAGTGATQSLTWDGRGDDGAVLDPATWSVAVRTVDSGYNLSDACTTEVTIDQHVQGPQ